MPAGDPRRIRKLDEGTIRQIAAGEVIERPASVVKELVENSLDAGAHEIRVALEGGGLQRIEVADDGVGIPVEEFPLAFERHATSKLDSAAQLPAVRTMGFRGEALASISAVARVLLTSRVRGKGAFATEVVAGEMGPVQAAARAVGTTLEVRDLFFNTPARRKFLRSETAEALRVSETLEQLYAGSPGVALSLSSGGTERFRFPPSGSLRETASVLFGEEFCERAFEFRGTGGPGIWIEGIASHPSVTRGTSGRIFLSANGRSITSRPLLDGLRAAYLDLIPRGRFPLALVRATVEGGYMDVNVHPTKREVRFQDDAELRESVRTLVRSTVQSAPLPSTPVIASGSSAARVPEGSWKSPSLQQTLSGEPGPFRPATELLTGAPNVSELFQASAAPPSRPEGLRVLGQVGDLYVIAELPSEDGALVLIDAHAASERIIFERLQSSTRHAHQALLSPVEVELTPRQRSAWDQYRAGVLELGFEVEPFGGSHFRVLGIPSFLWHRVEPGRLGALLDELAEGTRTEARESLHERVAKTVACHMAVRAGDSLTIEEMVRLVGELAETPNHFTCPHGRPVIVTLPRSQLNKWFHR